MIGILAIQGGVTEHEAILDELGILHKRVASLGDTEGLTGLILPGGESTVMDMFMKKYGIGKWLCATAKAGQARAQDASFKVFGTCAGLILLAKYGLLDVTVERNAYGRQIASFAAEIPVNLSDGEVLVRGEFIRAPKILRVGGGVSVLGWLDGNAVLVRSGNIWGATFHPELAGDGALHAAIFK
jgi:5'-phosphate synthase pdxT subunit